MERLKPSKYNFFFDADDGTHLAFNGVTGGLAFFDEETWQNVKRIMEDPNNFDWDTPKNKKLQESLLEGFYLVEENIDEIDLLRYKYNMGRFANDEFTLSICPTLDCNFACPYCYEGKYKVSGGMSQDVIQSIVSFLKDKIPTIRQLRIVWFGGEPLLEFDTIRIISQQLIKLCDDNKCLYGSSIITNGYLLTPDISKQLPELKIFGVQITIDPPPEYHDKRRVLKSGGGTYDRVLANTNQAAEYVQHIRLRLNSEKENIGDTFNYLEHPIFKKKNVIPSIGRITPMTVHCANIDSQCLTPLEYHQWAYKFEKRCRELGIGALPYPPTFLGYCVSLGISGFSIDPKGNLYKCLDLIGQEREIVGVIKDNKLKTNRKLIPWQLWDPFAVSLCRSCKFFAVCRGGCPHREMNGEPIEERWTGWKHAFLDKLRDYYVSTSSSQIEGR